MKQKNKKQLSTDSGLKDILFEIGCEELPATNLADIFETAALEKRDAMPVARLKKVFEDKRLGFSQCTVWATPRRLVFLLKGVPSTQSTKENLIKGPSKQDAFLPDGKPSDKLLGFIRAKQATLEDLQVMDNQGREYVYIKQYEAARKTKDVLPEAMDALVRSLSFPKNMRWDSSGVHFPRPIRSYLCFYGKENPSFKIGEIKVSNEISIFSKSTRKKLRVRSIEDYFRLLKKEGVTLDLVERKKKIAEELSRTAKSFKGVLYEDPFLLSEVNFLAENPSVLSAPFDPEFLKLPLEVLTVSMARKQRIFGVLDSKNQVIPRFLGVTDGVFNKSEKDLISKNYEHILHAKLKDSLFFYKEDIKVGLEKKRQELKGLIFLKNAGSMLEKSERLVKLSKKIGSAAQLSRDEQGYLERACFLSKSDLLTQMVGEFPELQGVIGKYYALESGEEIRVAEAIGEQYLPRTVSDKIPATLSGGLLSILDKTDLIVACFGLGLEPSSSLDPYGLRRSATAILKILIDKKINCSLPELLAAAKTELGAYVSKEKEAELLKKLDHFFKDRFKALVTDRGFRTELADAVTASEFTGVSDAYRRLEALSAIFSQESFKQTWKVVERTMNILKGNKEPLGDVIDSVLFTEDLEKQVFEHYQASYEAIRKATEARDYKLATSLYAGAFFDILDQFFNKVFVNAEDKAVRKNRLGLLHLVNRLYTEKIADLSKVTPATV